MSRWFLAPLRFILRPWVRYVLCWLVALAITGVMYTQARLAFSPLWDEVARGRADGNRGHTLIDFGGQWLMARMLVAGHGRELYSRPVQWTELVAGYPREDESPTQEWPDARWLFEWMADLPGQPRPFPPDPDQPRIGGPLYPPTHALLYAPLGLLRPAQGYHLVQVLSIGLTWLAGAAVAGISNGRLWWPVATAFLMAFPGFQGGLFLGQNSLISLAILAVGWYFVARGWELTGGAVWGLLAYKPVWAAAFILVPLFTGRRRMFVGMLGMGLLLGLLTLPLVGVQQWLNWLAIGRTAAEHYNVQDNWIFLGRDLLGVPRRWLLDFRKPFEERDRPIAAVIGWGLWLTVVGGTAVVAWMRKKQVRAVDGYGAAFVGIGAWASCFHFIYYDTLLAALPVVLLLTDPRRFLRPVVFAAVPVPESVASDYSPRPLRELPDAQEAASRVRPTAVLNSAVLTFVALLIAIEQSFNNLSIDATVLIGALPTGGGVPNPLTFSTKQHGTPWDTFVLLTLWAYCGARVLMSNGDERDPD